MSRFAGIDLSLLPAPQVIETLDFEAVLAALKADLTARHPEAEAVLALESEPLVKLLEAVAYREILLRARINDAARAVMLAHATGGDLENLTALLGVARLPEETDRALRARAQLSLEGYSTAGPRAAYEFHARSASAEVADIAVTSDAPGEVIVTVLSTQGNGAASAALRASVLAAVNGDEVRPLCAGVTVQSASLLPYAVEAVITVGAGPDADVVLAAAQSALAAYIAKTHALGATVSLSGLFAALHQGGAVRVSLASPAANIVATATQAPWCTGVSVTVEVGA